MLSECLPAFPFCPNFFKRIEGLNTRDWIGVFEIVGSKNRTYNNFDHDFSFDLAVRPVFLH